MWDSGIIYSNWDIVYVVTEDGGLSWSGERTISTVEALEPSGARDDRVSAAFSHGEVILAWASGNPLGVSGYPSVGGDYDVFLVTSSDFGRTWSNVTIVNEDQASNDTVVDNNGFLACDDSASAFSCVVRVTAVSDLTFFIPYATDGVVRLCVALPHLLLQYDLTYALLLINIRSPC